MDFKELMNTYYPLNEGKIKELGKAEKSFVKSNSLPLNATPEAIDRAIKSSDATKRIFAGLHRNSTEAHVGELLRDHEPSVRAAIAENHPLVTEAQLTNIFKHDNHPDVIKAAFNNPKVNSKHLDILLDHMPGTARTFEQRQFNTKVLSHRALTPAQITHVMTSGNFDNNHVTDVLAHPNSTEEHVALAIAPRFEDEHVHMNTMVHPKLTSAHIHQFIKNHILGETAGGYMVGAKAFDSSHIDAMLAKPVTGNKHDDYHNGEPTGQALGTPHATMAQINAALSHKNPHIREHAELVMKQKVGTRRTK